LIAGPNVFICDVCVGRVERSLTGPVPLEGVALAPEDSRIRCSFCRKRRSAVGSVVSSGRASICNLCINVCRQILTDSSE
jgi:ATP-dependent protease Clp ATPase subunit